MNQINELINKEPPPWEMTLSTWTQSTIDGYTGSKKIMYNKGIFLCICESSNKIYYSTDAINWTAVQVSHSGWNNICYTGGDGKFVI